MNAPTEIAFGYCRCGCNQKTELAEKTFVQRGWIKGQPKSYINGHQRLKHGFAYRGAKRSPEYRAYINAMSRCQNPNNAGYADYGGRGIRFQFESFEQFYSELGPRPPLHSLDRIDPNGNYAPGQCRWADARTQALNRRPRRSAPRGPYGPRRKRELLEKAA